MRPAALVRTAHEKHSSKRVVNLKKQKMYLLASRLGSIGTIVLVFLYFSIKVPNVWLTWYNFLNMIEQTVTLGLLAMGMTIIRAAGEMDMSMGSMVSLSSCLVMGLVMAGIAPWVAVILTLLMGVCAGFFNGFLRTVARIPGIIPTISTQGILAGVALVYTNGMAVYGAGPGVDALTRLGRGIEPGLILLGTAAVIWVILARTRYGRLVYMTGGNSEAAKFAGVRVNRVAMSAYILCATLGAGAGIMLAGRIGSGGPTIGADFLLDVIIAVMIGSTVLTQEQEFTGLGSLVGAFFMTVVNAGMQITGQGYPAQCLLRGILFLVCLWLFSLQRRATEA